MRVLVTSDTHLTDAALLPDGLLGAAEHADHIIHAGDVSALEVLRVLEQFAPVTAVCGNVEQGDVTATLPQRTTVELAGVLVGVVHDAGAAGGRHARLVGMFPGASLVVYGHSHMPEVSETAGGVWILNPGSPTRRRRAPEHTFAWVEIQHASITSCEIVSLP